MVNTWRLLSLRALALLLVVIMCRSGSFAYSVLTHEEIVDLVWTDEIRPLLLKSYPGLSPAPTVADNFTSRTPR